MDVVEWSLVFGAVGGIAMTFTLTYAWNFYRRWAFPISTPVIMQRGNGFQWDLTERAKHVKSVEGFESMQLMKRKNKLKPPVFKYVTVDQKGKPVYPLFNTTFGQYHIMDVRNNVALESVEDKGAMNWALQMLSDNFTRYMPKETMGAILIKYVAPIAFAACIIFFVIYFGGKIEIAANTLSSAAASLAGAMDRFGAGPAIPPI